jgi:hypothetical protein
MDDALRAHTPRATDLYALLVIEDWKLSVFDGKLGADDVDRAF